MDVTEQESSNAQPAHATTASSAAQSLGTGKTQLAKPPPGYKILVVRDKEGKIRKIKRKLTPEEIAAQSNGNQGQSSGKGTAPSKGAVSSKETLPVKSTESAKTDTPVESKSLDNVLARRTIEEVAPPANKNAASKDNVSTNKPAIQAGASSITLAAASHTPGNDKESKSTASKEIGQGATEKAPLESDPTSSEALDQQKKERRERKMRTFKGSMWRGFVSVTGHALPTVEIGDMRDDDDIITDDDDLSDHSMNTDDESRSMDGEHHDASESRHSTASHNNTRDHHTQSGNGLQVQTQPALQALAGAAAGSTARKAPAAKQVPEHPNNKASEKDKVTVKILEKDLAKLEEQAALGETKLRRRWADFSYYFMASLSIVLPALFLVLGICICLMKGKPTSSHWSYLEQAIKVAISAWPIVFAAVVAQCLKTWATFRVERGVKLMELEQLVGSNSFGSAIKQPLVLHRLGLLTIIIFVLWCFSPLGSQALLHVYTSDYRMEMNKTTVHYVNMTGENKAFSWDIAPDGVVWDQMVQQMAIIYQSPLIDPPRKNFNQDLWNHPIVVRPDTQTYASNLGVPVFFDNTIFPDAPSSEASKLGNPQWEKFSFIMSTSMINFTCPTWSTKKGADFMDGGANSQFTRSTSGNLMVSMSSSPGEVWDVFSLASLNNPRTVELTNDTQTINATADYSFINCTVGLVFLDINVTCVRTADGISTIPDCYTVPDDPISPVKVTSTSRGISKVYNAIEPWVQSTNPTSTYKMTTTLTELFLKGGQIKNTSYDPERWQLADPTDPTDTYAFTQYISLLFNTWVGIGYCPLCSPYTSWATVQLSGDEALFANKTDVQWWYTGNQVYFIDTAFIALYFVCAAVLFIAGVASTVIEGMLVVPDVLGYASSVARNSRFLHLPKTSSNISGPQRVREVGNTVVMMQDVKAGADVGRIALGNKHEKATRLQAGRLYR